MRTYDVWNDVLPFESRDLVIRLYADRHNRKPSAEKATQIAAHLTQGRQFFESARSAGDLARPLLLYYGVLALSRGLVIFLDHRITETGLSSSHGLELLQWNNTLRSKSAGLKQIPELSVRVTSGTFRELCDATRNAELSHLRIQPKPPQRPGVLRILGTPEVPLGLEMSLRDVWGRLADLSGHYWLAFENQPQCYPTSWTFAWPEQTRPSFELTLAKSSAPASKEDLLNALRIPESAIVERETQRPDKERRVMLRFGSLLELQQQIPMLQRDAHGKEFAVSPLADGTRISSVGLLYIASYAVGMLVRYFPSTWRKLSSQVLEDRVFPLMKASVAVIETEFPELIVEHLTFPHDTPYWYPLE